MTNKLYRSRTDKMIAGVCGGLGQYLRIDPVIVRLFFLLLGLASGIGVPLYLILWIIVPYEGESVAGSASAARAGGGEIAERARMMGEDVRDALSRPNPQVGIIIGAALVIFGLLALVRNLHIPWLYWLRFDLLWPLLLIIGGAVLIWRRGSGNR
jgi:phage shock protein C